MERTYRLEFNEKQQHFHLDNFTHQPNTFGWFTIFEKCTDLEFKIYKSYINREPKKVYTKDYLIKSARELENFTDHLLNRGLAVSKH